MNKELVAILAAVFGFTAAFLVISRLVAEPYRMQALLAMVMAAVVGGSVWAARTYYRSHR